MHERLKLHHHKHTGRLRPHEFTSYFPLAILLVMVGVALTISTVSAAPPPPQSSSVGLTGTMPGSAPKTAATITSPTQQRRFSTSPITIAGTCPPETLVQIYKNDIFAGSTQCGKDGKYSFDIDLLIGQNVLIAKVYDSLNQPGPDSNPVTVFYDALPPQAGPLASLNFGGTQLLLNTDAVFRGTFPKQELSVPISVIGGTPPYAINVQWGDSNNKVIPRNNNLVFNATHTYDKPGAYQITLQATDAQERVAFLSVAAIVNGQPIIASTSGTPAGAANKLLVLWPLYISSAGIVVSFWMGERREKRVLSKVPIQTHL